MFAVVMLLVSSVAATVYAIWACVPCTLIILVFLCLQELAVAEAKNLMLPEGRKTHNSNTSQQQQRDEDLEDAADPANCFATCKCGSCQLCRLRQYTRHPWNINNLPQAKGSVLRFVREDVGGKPITGESESAWCSM